MTLSKFTALVSTHWLKEQILTSVRDAAKLSNSLRVLDTSWQPEPDVDGYKQFYVQAHIPTAVHFDLKKVSSPSETSAAKFPIPDSNIFKDYVESLGINNDTHVIAYDRFNTRMSFRTWFLFRLFGHDKVSILNGGMRQWLTDGYNVTTEEPVVEGSMFIVFCGSSTAVENLGATITRAQDRSGKEIFHVNFRKNLLRDYTSVLKNTDTKVEQLIDARPSDGFYVRDEGSPGGHIPGAKSIPMSNLFNEDGTVKSNQELQKLFTDAGVDLSRPVVTTCLTGMTACSLMFAAYLLGKDDVPLYNGSFTEWSKLADPSKTVREKPPSQ